MPYDNILFNTTFVGEELYVSIFVYAHHRKRSKKKIVWECILTGLSVYIGGAMAIAALSSGDSSMLGGVVVWAGIGALGIWLFCSGMKKKIR